MSARAWVFTRTLSVICERPKDGGSGSSSDLTLPEPPGLGFVFTSSQSSLGNPGHLGRDVVMRVCSGDRPC